ncbi:MAG: aminotransferase class III-fold pyridoxal phosphate-dependent enzyme [Opitutaceae bacterium]|nr:aminotransferase class III-fold pyridoxal phosphate-dependent enzyme [Opitutaceae bacterium]
MPSHPNTPPRTGPDLYRRAKHRIPGGTQLLSKRPEMFLPDNWPAYYRRAQGCTVWDLDDRPYVDFTSCGIGCCLLGYADETVNAAVTRRIADGSMCTLNSPDEVELADRLCRLHPWAEQVRYTRCGGEAMAVAVRIARAATGRSTVAFCGYHGWSDWYLAANVGERTALNGHLLAGLDPAGVPPGLGGSALPFRYQQIGDLEAILAAQPNGIAAIVMEPMRLEAPRGDFLVRVRQLADRHGAVLIFDEITAGWRSHHGGIHLTLGVNPDIAVFAKAMSNGFPMAAIIGRTAVMEAAQQSFISSTYWTEAIGPAAALATITRLAETDAAAHIRRIGTQTAAGWRTLGERHGLKLRSAGIPALCSFAFDHGADSLPLMTLFTQEMLARGFLANGLFYPTLAHTPAIVEQYLAAVDAVFAMLRTHLDRHDVAAALRGPVVHTGFARLT